MLPRLAGGGNLVHFLDGQRLFDVACVPADKLVNDPGWPGGLYAIRRAVLFEIRESHENPSFVGGHDESVFRNVRIGFTLHSGPANY